MIIAMSVFNEYVKASRLQYHYQSMMWFFAVLGVAFAVGAAIWGHLRSQKSKDYMSVMSGLAILGLLCIFPFIHYSMAFNNVKLPTNKVYRAAFTTKTTRYDSYKVVNNGKHTYYIVGGKRYDPATDNVKTVDTISNHDHNRRNATVTTPQLRSGLSKHDLKVLKQALDNDGDGFGTSYYNLSNDDHPSLKTLVHGYQVTYTKVTLEKN